MRVRAHIGLIPLIVSLALGGCDSYVVLAQFHKSGGALSLTLQSSSVAQGGTVSLYPGGGNPPYSFALIQGNLAVSGTLGSVSNQTYTTGTGIGTVTIQLADTSGDTVQSVVTVLPPTPTNFALTPTTNSTTGVKSIIVSWSYANPGLATQFSIQRSTDGISFTNLTTVASSSATSYSYTDSGLNQNQTYYYRVYAVAGSYQSFATSVLGAKP